jgi:hypothetical protein
LDVVSREGFTYGFVQYTAEGGEPYVDRGLGRIRGREGFRKFGHAEIGTTYQDVTPFGNTTLHTTAAVLGVVSSSTADVSPGGTGARLIYVVGLDANYEEIGELIALNGQTPVASTAEFLRVNRAYCLTAGSGEKNAGNITITISGDTVALIEASFGQTQQVVYTVPLNYMLVLTQWHASIGTGRQVTAHIDTRDFSTAPVWRTRDEIVAVANDVEREFSGTVYIDEKGVVRANAKTDQASTPMTVALYGELVRKVDNG